MTNPSGGFPKVQEAVSAKAIHASSRLPGSLLAAAVAIAAAIWAVIYSYLFQMSGWLARLVPLDAESHSGKAVSFFIYETPKVLLLLLLIVFVVGVVRSFITPDRTRRMLAGRRETA